MISGAHMIVYSADAEADRAFCRDILKFPAVDGGGGWLIFALPPSEVALHPVAEGRTHEIHLMCPDIQTEIAALAARDIACTPVSDEGWGLLTHLTLPGSGKLGLYQPRHPLAADAARRLGR
jgi:hypothetical protein